MPGESIRRQIEAAAEAVRRGDAARALEEANAVIAAEPDAAEAHQIRGIALTRLGNIEAAGTSFRRATELDPISAKHWTNLAVNLRDRGMSEEALTSVDEALRLDPENSAGRQLRAELTGVPLPVENAPDASRPAAPRVGYRDQSRHLLPFLAGMEQVWTVIGATFLAMDVLLGVLMIVHLPMTTTGHVTPPSKLPDVVLRHDRLSIFIVFLYIITWVCTFMWMFVDVIDLRRRFSWLVPFIACSILGFTAVPLALYMGLGRTIEPPDPT